MGWGCRRPRDVGITAWSPPRGWLGAIKSIILDMNFDHIGALKVFADLGALIEEDEKTHIIFMDLTVEIIQNNLASHLLKGKKMYNCFIKFKMMN